MSVFKDHNGHNLTFSVALGKIGRRLFSYIEDLELLIVDVVGWVPWHFIRLLFYRAAGMKIGPGSHIHVGARFFEPTGISIGRGTVIGEQAFLDGRGKLSIGHQVGFASEVMVYTSEHDINDPDFKAINQPVRIEDYVFVGPRAIILPGVKIGKGAVVAAGAVVTKDVEELEIVGGVPAQVIGHRQAKDLNYQLGRVRLFQ